MRELDPAHQIARRGKVRTHFPSTSIVFQPTWSTCEVGAQHRVDRLGWEAGRREVGEERSWRLFQVGMRRFSLSLPSRVSTMMRCLGSDDERVDAHPEAAALVGEMRLQPSDRQGFPRTSPAAG